jgi:hypothetical protein
MKYVTLSPGCAFGVSDRQIAHAGLMGRVKAGKLRLLAQEQGWLVLRSLNSIEL